MAKPVQIARRVIALAADAASSSVKITSHVPLVTRPRDLFGKKLADLGISDDDTILVFKSHLQTLVKEHLPEVKVRHLDVTRDTHLGELSTRLMHLFVAEMGTHGTDEPPPKRKRKGTV